MFILAYNASVLFACLFYSPFFNTSIYTKGICLHKTEISQTLDALKKL